MKVGHPGVISLLLQLQDIHLPVLHYTAETRGSAVTVRCTTLLPLIINQLPPHMSVCPCCTFLVLLCANVLVQMEGNPAELAQPLVCLPARCPLWVNAVQFLLT